MKPADKITILVDNREQIPWEFDPEQFDVKKTHLPTGDYMIEGLEDRIVLEKKSLGDFVNTVIHDWIRFRKELYRLASYDVSAIIVEADISDIFEHRYESEVPPASVFGRANGIFLDHGIPVYFWGSRKYAIPMVERLFIQAAKKLTTPRESMFSK